MNELNHDKLYYVLFNDDYTDVVLINRPNLYRTLSLSFFSLLTLIVRL